MRARERIYTAGRAASDAAGRRRAAAAPQRLLLHQHLLGMPLCVCVCGIVRVSLWPNDSSSIIFLIVSPLLSFYPPLVLNFNAVLCAIFHHIYIYHFSSFLASFLLFAQVNLYRKTPTDDRPVGLRVAAELQRLAAGLSAPDCVEELCGKLLSKFQNLATAVQRNKVTSHTPYPSFFCFVFSPFPRLLFMYVRMSSLSSL